MAAATGLEPPLTRADSSPQPPAGPGLRRRLWLGFSRNLVTAVFVQGSTLALNLFAARALPVRVFGDFLMMLTTLATAGGIGQLASGYTATKYLAEFRVTDPARAGRILALCSIVAMSGALLTALVLGGSAPWLASQWLKAPHLTVSLVIVAVAAVFVVMNGQRTGVLNGLEAYTPLARIGVVSGVTYGAFGMLGVYLAGLNGGLIGIGASACVQWVLLGRGASHALRHHGIDVRFSDALREKPKVVHFALPASLGGLVSMSAVWLAAGLLVRNPDGGEQLALFGAANSFRVMVLFLPLVVCSVGTTLLNNQLGNEGGYRRVFWGTLGLAVGSAGFGAVVMVVLGAQLLQVFGSEFEPASSALRVLMVAALAEASANNIYQVVQSHAQMWRSLCLIVIPRDTALVTLAFFLTPTYGADGLAIAYACAWTLALLIVATWTYTMGLAATGIRRGDAEPERA
jgi:O-antigen/teichoic acid export membrane protein